MTPTEWNICTRCFTLREIMILLRYEFITTSIPGFFLNGIGFVKIGVWKEPFPFSKKSTALSEPLNRDIGVFWCFCKATVLKPFRQSLMCCTVVYSKYIFVIQKVKSVSYLLLLQNVSRYRIIVLIQWSQFMNPSGSDNLRTSN